MASLLLIWIGLLNLVSLEFIAIAVLVEVLARYLEVIFHFLLFLKKFEPCVTSLSVVEGRCQTTITSWNPIVESEGPDIDHTSSLTRRRSAKVHYL